MKGSKRLRKELMTTFVASMGVDRVLTPLNLLNNFKMAKILLGGFGPSDVRNQLGGVVFSKNSYGNYVRNNTNPVNPQTPLQTLYRNVFQTVTQLWKTLTVPQRLLWNQVAAASYVQRDVFGNDYNLTGFGLFCKLNMSLGGIHLPYVEDAPAEEAIEPLTNLEGTFDVKPATADKFEISYMIGGVGDVPATRRLLLEATAPVSPGKRYAKNLFRQVTVLQNGQAAPHDARLLYEIVFGNVTEANVGDRIFLRGTVVSQTNGQRGSEVISSDIIITS